MATIPDILPTDKLLFAKAYTAALHGQAGRASSDAQGRYWFVGADTSVRQLDNTDARHLVLGERIAARPVLERVTEVLETTAFCQHH